MTDQPKKRGQKPLGVKQWPALLLDEQITALRQEGETRGRNKGNAVLRDVISFWIAYYPLYKTWISYRRTSSQEQQP